MAVVFILKQKQAADPPDMVSVAGGGILGRNMNWERRRPC